MHGVEGRQLGDRDLKIREDLEQKRLELLVGPVDLVDQEHRGARAGVSDRLKKRAFQQELVTKNRLLQLLTLCLISLRHADMENLTGVVPLVEGGAGVEALVALETDQRGVENRRDDLRDLGLPDTRLTLQEDRFLELRGEHHGDSEGAARDVAVTGEGRLDGAGRREQSLRRIGHRCTSGEREGCRG